MRLFFVCFVLVLFVGCSPYHKNIKPTLEWHVSKNENDGFAEMLAKLQAELYYPKQTVKEGVEGYVYVSFLLQGTGEITDVAIDSGINEAVDKAVLRAVEKLGYCKKTDASLSESPIRYGFQVAFALPKTLTGDSAVRKPSGFVYIENRPEYPGGDTALLKYLRENTVYPAPLLHDNMAGLVFVRFLIAASGSVTKISVVRGAHPLMDKAAMEAVRKMPRWKPGNSRGRAKAVWYVVPIRFAPN